MSSFAAVPTTETERIADQLRRIYRGPAWLGPSVLETLAGVDEQLANRRSIPGAHTIWELVLHITAWMRIARERLSATQTRDYTEAENWPPVSGSWENALSMLEREVGQLEQAVLAFPDARLNDPAPATEPQTYYVLLQGVVQHNAYHAGQIMLLKK